MMYMTFAVMSACMLIFVASALVGINLKKENAKQANDQIAVELEEEKEALNGANA